MTVTLKRIFACTLGMIGCVGVAWVIAALMPKSGAGNYQDVGLEAALFLVAWAVFLKLKYRWDTPVLLGALAVSEALLMTAILVFSGSGPLAANPTFSAWGWFGYANLYLGLPWLFGIAVGRGLRESLQ